MRLFFRLRSNRTSILLGALLLFLVSLQCWVTYSNYQNEKKLLVRNLNESMQSSFESFRSFNSSADTIRNVLLNVSEKKPFAEPETAGENLIRNPEFDLGDTLFFSDYVAYKPSPGALLPDYKGRYYVLDSTGLSFVSWRGKGFGGGGLFLSADGALSPERTVWGQQVPLKKNQSYYFRFRMATIGFPASQPTKNNYWQIALLAVKINGKTVGYISGPGHPQEWTPFQYEWNSGNDSIAKIELINLNTGGRYNDLGIDHIGLFALENDSVAENQKPFLINPQQLKPDGSLAEKISITEELVREELRFRSLSGDFTIQSIPLNGLYEKEADAIQRFGFAYTKYYERYYVKDGKLYSSYYHFDDQMLGKACLIDYQKILFGKISGQVLLLAFSFFLSLLSLLLIRRYLRKQEQVNRLKYDITGSITHELKTPVATILAAAEALQHFRMIDDKEKAERYIEITRVQANRLNELIEKALGFSAVEEDGFALDLNEINLNELIRELAADATYARTEKFALQIQLPETPVMLAVDAFHVKNILHTILDNSIKYSTASLSVSITMKMQNDSVLVSVKDNGNGIAPEYQKLVFEKYFRIPTGDRYVVKGHGLGLHYVKTIMDLHGGSVRIHSDGKTGTEILLKFKLKNKSR